MAIDTAQKRYSLLGLGSPVPRLLPIPQGTVAADDRALLLFLYAGLTLGAAVAETPSGGWRPRHLSPRLRQREQTDEEIKAERIRLGIIQPDPTPAPPPSEPGLQGRRAFAEVQDEPVAAPRQRPAPTAQAAEARRLATIRAEQEALAEANAALDLAGVYAAGELDLEIARYFRLQEEEERAQLLADEQRRFAEQLLEDDEAFLMILAVAIH